MSSAALAAQATEELEKRLQSGTNAYIDMQTAGWRQDLYETNARNTAQATQAQAETSQFRSDTAGMQADLQQSASGFSGFGHNATLAQASSNIDAARDENSANLQRRADVISGNAIITNAINAGNYDKSATDWKSIVNMGFSGGGILGGLGTIIWSAIKGGKAPNFDRLTNPMFDRTAIAGDVNFYLGNMAGRKANIGSQGDTKNIQDNIDKANDTMQDSIDQLGNQEAAQGTHLQNDSVSSAPSYTTSMADAFIANQKDMYAQVQGTDMRAGEATPRSSVSSLPMGAEASNGVGQLPSWTRVSTNTAPGRVMFTPDYTHDTPLGRFPGITLPKPGSTDADNLSTSVSLSDGSLNVPASTIGSGTIRSSAGSMGAMGDISSPSSGSEAPSSSEPLPSTSNEI